MTDVKAPDPSMSLTIPANTAVIPGPRRGRIPQYARPLVDLLDEYLRLVAIKRRETTLVTYRSHLERFCKWLVKSHGISVAGHISPDTLKTYSEHIREMEAEGTWKASTANNHLNPTRAFLRWMVAEGAVFDRSPEGEPWVTETRINQWLGDVRDTSRPTRKERALSPDEVRRLLSAIPDARDLALFTLLAGSGLRVSECCALRAGDVEIRSDGAGIVHVLDGKGGKARSVPIADTVLGPVYAWSVAEGMRLGDPSDTRVLWPGKRGEGVALKRIRVYQLLQDYAVAAGITRKISPHNLRHTFGTEFYRSRRDPVAVAEALGHSGLAYVQTYVKSIEAGEAVPFRPEWAKP